MSELSVLEPETKIIKFQDDPLFSIIAPIFDLPPMVFKRFLMSVEEQDYKNLEVVLVFDGPNVELEKIADHFKLHRKKKIVIEHAGACAARNAGFKESTGEIVAFLNSDYICKPGMIRMWVDKLLANPDCGFAYGGYEYNTAQRYPYWSKEFDVEQLMTANYIDCGFPLWRKYVVEWDINCKSLQDWDFWIRVVKEHKVKGFYLGRDLSFVAELPRKKGLSDDSSSNWIDRVNYVKTKNGIEKRDILVTSLGAPYHGKMIAQMIGADFRDDTIYKPCDYKALYMIGFYIKPNEAGLNEHARILAHFKDTYPNTKRIVHFVGADIYWLRKFPYESLKYLAGALKGSCDHILSENQEAHDELLEYGIPTEIVPIPSYTDNWEVKPLPKEFSVGLYLVEPGTGDGQSDFDKYCYEPTLSIVRAMPDVKFVGYGKGGWDVQYPNLEIKKSISREEWPNFVYSQSALLRLCRHDHNPMASNEFIMAGREVITNVPTLGATMIDTSGKSELNEWDKFGDGFSSTNWPSTKKKIVSAILNLKKFTMGHMVLSEAPKTLKKLLDKNVFISKIREMLNGK